MELLKQKEWLLFNKASLNQLQGSILPFIARIFLLATFIEDGVRVGLQFKAQHQYLSVAWAETPSWGPATALITISVLGHVVPPVLVLARKFVMSSCLVLALMVFYHTVLYQTHLDLRFLFVHLAILGGLLLLAAETHHQPNKHFPRPKLVVLGPPQPEISADKKSKTLLQLAGRILIPLMLLSLVHVQELNSPLRIAEIGIAGLLMFMVIIGFKARWCALALSGWLFVGNVVLNNWWRFPPSHPYREFAKFDFFQTLSVSGGLLLVFCHGPGRASLDEYNKKNW